MRREGRGGPGSHTAAHHELSVAWHCLQRFMSVVVAERAVGGAVQGHDARNLSHHLIQFLRTSIAQYKTLLDMHRSIHTRVAASLATARGECRPGCNMDFCGS